MRRFPVWNIRHESEYSSVIEAIFTCREMAPEDLDVGPGVLHPPELMSDMDRAVERLAHAIRAGERIIVFGDYDVDGITSTALVLDFLEHVGADAGYILPGRHAHGYGLKPDDIAQVQARGARLVVTVDNGISALEAVRFAGQHGVDVVVTDHHRQLDALPEAVAVIDPHRRDCAYPFKGLAGVGVAFKLVQALSTQFMDGAERRSYLNGLLDLVALGTVGDLMPVLDENRLFIQRGLRVMNDARRVGLRALMDAAGYADKRVDAHGVAFHLGPRLNVAGRLETPDLALQLLRCQDAHEAAQLARRLNLLNSQRQVLQRCGFEEARRLVSAVDLESDRMVFLLGEDWHLGVIGLLASKLAEMHARPAVVCTARRGDGTYTGSARSIPGYDISAAIGDCGELLLDYGGHPAAAGFSLHEERFEEFRVRLLEHAREHIDAKALEPCLDVDVILRPEDVSRATLVALQRLEPFGPGNPLPVFGVRGCQVRRGASFGRLKDHLRVELRHGELTLRGVWWNQGAQAADWAPGQRVDAAFVLRADDYGGRNGVQLELRDMRSD